MTCLGPRQESAATRHRKGTARYLSACALQAWALASYGQWLCSWHLQRQWGGTPGLGCLKAQQGLHRAWHSLTPLQVLAESVAAQPEPLLAACAAAPATVRLPAGDMQQSPMASMQQPQHSCIHQASAQQTPCQCQSTVGLPHGTWQSGMHCSPAGAAEGAGRWAAAPPLSSLAST